MRALGLLMILPFMLAGLAVMARAAGARDIDVRESATGWSDSSSQTVSNP